MKLISTSILAAATLMLGAANANAGVAIDWYTGATAGMGHQTIKTDNTSFKGSVKSYGAVAGFDIPFVRAEAEYNYMHGKVADIQAGFINAYAKMPGLGVVMPYIGGGIGVVWKVDVNKDKTGSFDYKESGKPMYQGMLGVTLNVPTLPFKVDVEGRVLYTPKLIDVTTYDVTAKDTQIDARAKIRYIF